MDEKRLRNLVNKDPKSGEELGKLTELQNSASAINSERINALEMEKSVAQSNYNNNTNLQAEVGIAMNSQGQNVPQSQPRALPQSASGLRPETQALLSQYGINPRISETSNKNGSTKTTRNSTVNTSTSRDNNGSKEGTKVTNTTNISNVTNNNITNETKVDASQKAAPVVVPPTSNPANQDTMAKYKTWLDSTMNKQNQQYELQKREFRKRDWSLKRYTEKMLDKMSSITKGLASRLDPANMTKTFTNQINVFMVMLGSMLLVKFFNPLKKIVAEVVGSVKSIFGSDDPDAEKSYVGKLKRGIVEALGGDPKKGDTFFSSLKGLFSDLGSYIKDSLNHLFEDRATAVKSIDAPSLTKHWVLPNIGEWLQYISKVLTAAVGGTKGLLDSKVKNIVDDKSKTALSGDEGKGQDTSAYGRNIIKDDDRDILGRLKTSSSDEMSRAMLRTMTDKSVDIAPVAAMSKGFQDLESVSKRDKEGAKVDKEAIKTILGLDLWNKLVKDGKLQEKTHYYGYEVGGGVSKRLSKDLGYSKPDQTKYYVNKEVKEIVLTPEVISEIKSLMNAKSFTHDDENFSKFVTSRSKSLKGTLNSGISDVKVGIYSDNEAKKYMALHEESKENEPNIENYERLNKTVESLGSAVNSATESVANFATNLSGKTIRNNPGNIMDLDYYKSTGKFRLKEYSSLEEGYAALFRLLSGKGYIGSNNHNTIRTIFPKYAPKGHGNNDPKIYSENVSNWTGIDQDKKLTADEDTLKKLVKAITRQEHGVVGPMVSRAIEDGYNLYSGRSRKSTNAAESSVEPKLNATNTPEANSYLQVPNYSDFTKNEFKSPILMKDNTPALNTETQVRVSQDKPSTDTKPSVPTAPVIVKGGDDRSDRSSVQINNYNTSDTKTAKGMYGLK